METHYGITPTSVEFWTDEIYPCIQQRMKYNSGVTIDRLNPMVGDFVLVYHDSELRVHMRVSERSWRLVNGTPEALVVVLEAPCERTHPAYSYAYWKFIHTFEIAHVDTRTSPKTEENG